jgi:hypothetical protein
MRVPFVRSIQLVALVAVALAAACASTGAPPIQVKSMPEGGSFTGVWFSPQYGEMHVLQSGSSAIGRYTKDERVGRLQGNIEGDVMRFEWKEQRELIVGRPVTTKGHGYFRIVKDDVENSWKLLGEWGNDDAERGGGPWTAVKSRTRKPEIDAAGNPAEASGSERTESTTSDSADDDSSSGSDDLGDL